MSRGPGSTCRLRVLTWEGAPLDLREIEGDFLRTARGTCYRIDSVRLCRAGSKALATLHVTRLERDAVADGAVGVHRWTFGQR